MWSEKSRNHMIGLLSLTDSPSYRNSQQQEWHIYFQDVIYSSHSPFKSQDCYLRFDRQSNIETLKS